MLLADLLQDVVLENVPDLEIGGVCSDSRKVKSGDLFFALLGTKEDGGRYVAEAVKGGASAVVAEKNSVCPADIPFVLVKDARRALALAARRLYEDPTRCFYLCGATGTNGKTTLTYILENIWGAQNTGVMGTVNMRYQDKILPTDLTTPDTVTLQKFFGEMAKNQVKYVVAEVSSHALQQKRASGCQFDSAVFTNLTQDHLDYHVDMEDYFQAKMILFDELALYSEKKNKLAVVNQDDPYGQRLIKKLKENGVHCKTFSMKEGGGDIFVVSSECLIKETRAQMICNGKKIEVVTNLLGRHNLQNIMAAVLVAEHSGIGIDDILSALKKVKVPGRLDRVLDTNIFVDYAHTPDALKNVLKSLREVIDQDAGAGRLNVVFGCGGDRDKGKRPLMGRAAAEFADVVMVTSDNPRTEDPQKIIENILPGVVENKAKFDGETGFVVETDRREALVKIVEMSRPEDVVVVAGKGHEDYQILGTEKIHFDDKEILEDLVSS